MAAARGDAFTERVVRLRTVYVHPPLDLAPPVARAPSAAGGPIAFGSANNPVKISSTTIAGQIWLRLAVLSFRTHVGEIDYLLELLTRVVHQLLAEFPPRSDS